MYEVFKMIIAWCSAHEILTFFLLLAAGGGVRQILVRRSHDNKRMKNREIKLLSAHNKALSKENKELRGVAGSGDDKEARLQVLETILTDDDYDLKKRLKRLEEDNG